MESVDGGHAGRVRRRECHSLVVGLPAASAEEWIGSGLRIWAEPTGRPRTDERTRALIAREAARGLSPDGPALRTTIVRHADGTADAVLVADRTVVDLAEMLRIGAGLRGGGGRRDDRQAHAAVALAGPRRADAVAEHGPGEIRSAVEWGLPDPVGTDGCIPLDITGSVKLSASVLLAASALTLARYDAATSAVLALGDGSVDVDVDVDDSEAVGAFLERVERADAGPHGTPAAVEVVFTAHDPDLAYRPYLTTPRPIVLHVELDGDTAVSGSCHYAAAAVCAPIARGFARHLLHVAGQLAAAAPDRPLSEIELMPPAEAAAVLAAGAAAAPAADVSVTIHQALRDVADRFPNRPAVSDSERVLTYRELVLEAERRALGLVALGVRPGHFVGVCAERTSDLVVTLLAVLLADAAYVPLDPHNPADRLRFIAEDAGLQLVVADEDAFPSDGPARVVSPSSLAFGAPLVDYVARPGGARPDDPAYVIYTSGSTGRPKGVVVPHRNVAALVAAVEDFELDETDVWTLFHSSSFDFSVWEIWGCLLTGGRLVVVPHLVARSPAEFRELLVRERVTVLSQTPSAFANLLDADARGGDRLALRLVVFGGEPLDVRMLRGWFARHPAAECRMVNMFGITETTVHVTAKTVTPADVRLRSRSVGPALPGWSVSVRDPLGRLVPPGVPGEIHVGGAGVAIGYHGRDDLTEARFVEDRFGSGRIYRSGDRGRLRPDGALDHLGRLDSQVKIRGYRIELDEIRSVLQDDQAVQTAALCVTAADDDPAEARIAAYVILGGGATGPAAREVVRAVRRRIAELLPDYMLPASITPLPELPLTANGKLDVTCLPPPRAVEPDDARPEAGDRIPDTVVRVWRRVLAQPVGLDDDFFDNGGNSLAAVRVLNGIAEAGLPRLAVPDLYRCRTAAKLAALVEERRARDREHESD